MADWGVKVTRDGYDTKDASLKEQSFNSEKNCLKIGKKGSETSTASGSRTLTIAHGLSVTPAFLLWFTVGSSGNWYPCFSTEYGSGSLATVSAYTDGTNLKIDITTNNSQTVKIYYVIFVDKGD